MTELYNFNNQFGLYGTFKTAAHIFESGWNNITFESQGDIGIMHSYSDFDLRMTLCDLEFFLGEC